MNKKLILAILILLLGTAVFSYRVKIKNLYYDLRKSDLPATVSYTDLPAQPGELGLNEEVSSEDDTKGVVEIQPEINLAVPFTVQAPEADWSLPYKEACEEAAILMAVYYLQNKGLNPEVAKTEIDNMVEWQQVNWGGHYDLTITDTARLVQEYFVVFKTTIISDLSIDKVKSYLNQGFPVIVPAAGRELGNPFFQTPGPLYHMLIIKGYTDDMFITNDPGTKRGQDFVYIQDVLMSAIHDWDGQGLGGDKVGLVISD